MQIFNGTPLPVIGLAEGNRYVIGPGEVVDIENDNHGRTLLDNLHPRGIRQIRHGDDQNAIREESIACLAEHIKQNIEEYNATQMDLSRQGLKLLPANKQLMELARVLERLGDEPLDVKTQKTIDDDPVASVVQRLAAAVKQLGDTPEGKKLAVMLEELASVKAKDPDEAGSERSKILTAHDLTGAVGTARVRANARARQIRRGKAAGGKK